MYSTHLNCNLSIYVQAPNKYTNPFHSYFQTILLNIVKYIIILQEILRIIVFTKLKKASLTEQYELLVLLCGIL